MKAHINNGLNTLICSGLLLSTTLLFGSSTATTTIDYVANIDCMSPMVMTGYISNKEVYNDNMTYGYTVVLTEDYPICYHDSTFGVSIIWAADYEDDVSVYYYEWSESSGTCTPGTTNNTYTTSDTQLTTSNDYDGDDDDPCAYTFHL